VFECRVEDGARFFGIEIFNQLHRSFDVGEKRGDRLALALDILRRGRLGQSNWSGY
jgi:hypothetical protein